MKNTTHYSASDIQRYLNGEMSAREMFDMEKAALEDPFLADALEGYEAHPTAADDVHELRARLNTRVTAPTPARVRPLKTFFRIAVAAVLFIGLGFSAWYFLVNTKTGQPTVASQKVAPPAPTPLPPATADSTTRLSDSNIPATAVIPSRATTTPALKKAKIPPLVKTAPSASEYAKTAPPAVADQVRTDTIQDNIQGAAAGLAINDKKASPPAAINRERKLLAFGKDSLRVSGEFAPKIFSGRVLDFNNNPLSGATLHLSGSDNVATVTDGRGNFSLKINPRSTRDSVLHVNVGMIGYEPSSLAFNTLDPGAATGNLIYLKQQSNSLDEVVVIGYGSKRKETRAFVPSPSDETIDSLWISAMPVSGRQAYLDYLNSRKATIGADTTIRGTVVVSFDVSRKGALSSFKVERSLTPAHDAGVIRLVSEGPQWKVSKNHPVRAAVRVTF